MNRECKLRGWTKEKIKTFITKDKTRRQSSRQWKCLSWGVNYLTCVNTRFSELRLSRLRTKRIDWKSSWMLALNCSSSIPQVALEYRIRDWTMNLNRYSRAWGGCWQDTDGDTQSSKVHVISYYSSLTMNKHWLGLRLIIQRKSIHKRNVSNFQVS